MNAHAQAPSFQLLKFALKDTWRLYGFVFRRGWPTLVPLHIVQVLSGVFISYATDYLRQTGREDLAFIAVIAGLELVFSLLWSAAWILALVRVAESEREPMQRFPSALIEFFQQLVIEQVRTLAAILWRVPLLIVPALVEYVRLSFVPIVVLLDPDYPLGKVDALNESRRVARGRFVLISFLILISLSLPSLIDQIVGSSREEGISWLWTNPGPSLLGWTLTLFINIGTSLLLYSLYRHLISQARSGNPTEDSDAASLLSVDGN